MELGNTALLRVHIWASLPLRSGERYPRAGRCCRPLPRESGSRSRSAPTADLSMRRGMKAQKGFEVEARSLELSIATLANSRFHRASTYTSNMRPALLRTEDSNGNLASDRRGSGKPWRKETMKQTRADAVAASGKANRALRNGRGAVGSPRLAF